MPGGPWDTRHSLIPITDRNAAGIFMRVRAGRNKTNIWGFAANERIEEMKSFQNERKLFTRVFWVEEAGLQDNSQFVFQMCLPSRLWFLVLGSSLKTMGCLPSIACIHFDNLTALSQYFARVLNFVNCKSMTSRPKQSACRDKRDKENANMTQTTAVTSSLWHHNCDIIGFVIWEECPHQINRKLCWCIRYDC